MPVKAKKPKKVKAKKPFSPESFIDDLENRGELNKKHRHDFEGLLDTAAPKIPRKK